jgi:hypothetical protein
VVERWDADPPCEAGWCVQHLLRLVGWVQALAQRVKTKRKIDKRSKETNEKRSDALVGKIHQDRPKHPLHVHDHVCIQDSCTDLVQAPLSLFCWYCLNLGSLGWGKKLVVKNEIILNYDAPIAEILQNDPLLYS